jgi:hypothetical protein
MGILTSEDINNVLIHNPYQAIMAKGWAFDSGPIYDVPPSSTFIRGDATFDYLSTKAVALVAQGMMIVSTVVLQRRRNPLLLQEENWIPVFTSRPDRLSLACRPTRPSLNATKSLFWNCSTPRIVDMLESMPATTVLTREALRINVLYSYHESPATVWEEMDIDFNFVFADIAGAQELFNAMNVSDPAELVRETAVSSTYTIEHQSFLASSVEVAMRSVSAVTTCIFILFWWWSISSKGSGYGPSCFERTRDEEKAKLIGRVHGA